MNQSLKPVMLLALAFTVLTSTLSQAGEIDEKLPVSIQSPVSGKTFAYGQIKSRTLDWDAKKNMLMAHITFTNQLLAVSGDVEEDDQYFPIPGIVFNPANGYFFAPTSEGTMIPIAHIHKALFMKTIMVLPNAAVRVIHTSEGEVTVKLEAIRPEDVDRYSKQGGEATPKGFSLQSIFQ